MHSTSTPPLHQLCAENRARVLLGDPEAAGAAGSGLEHDWVGEIAAALHDRDRGVHDGVGRIVLQVNADARIAGNLLGFVLGDHVVSETVGFATIAGNLGH